MKTEKKVAKKKVETKKIVETKYEMNDVIETKDGLFQILGIMLWPGTYEYMVMVDGKHVPIQEKNVIAGYKELDCGKQKSAPRIRKPKSLKKDAPTTSTENAKVD